MDYKKFYKLLNKYRFISLIYEEILKIIENEIKNKENINEILNIFSIYFSLIEEGNTTISLNKEVLKNKRNKEIEGKRILLENDPEFNNDEFNEIINESNNLIDNYLSLINEFNLSEIIGINKIFEIEDNYLYLKKFNHARKDIIEDISTLFNNKNIDNKENKFNYLDYVKDVKFRLSLNQEKIIKEGINKNLIITGGPGTGKTTSIFFLLISLFISGYSNYEVYLCAPSGKASSRMKQSILEGLDRLNNSFLLKYKDYATKISNLNESTIHRLLGIDNETNGFKFNKYNKFDKKSIFIIDEASMIDVSLFSSLLNAINEGSRIFIMGDKNQLPSVDSGAVFSDLLNIDKLKENIIELDESNRFKENTKIYELASLINKGKELPLKNDDFKSYLEFKIEKENDIKPIFYYESDYINVKNKDLINHIICIWGNEYFKKLQNSSTNINIYDFDSLIFLYEKSEEGKILASENEGYFGVKYINSYIKKKFIDNSFNTSLIGYYPGMLMMITKNNSLLDLYNGDSGIVVKIKDDSTLYLMVKKSTFLVNSEGYQKDKIFKIKDYTFYPLRIISSKDITLSYAITIHKSQGSDYKNILVILPSKKGHPLLNRQILYTAITRTKGNTYILSNLDRLNEAKDNLIIRDTNIKI